MDISGARNVYSVSRVLYTGLSGLTTSEFIPHLAIGFIAWTLLGGFLLRSHNVFTRNKAYLMQGGVLPTSIILIDITELFIHFLHQTFIIILVCWYFKTISGFYFLTSIAGLFFIVLNGYWMTFVFGLIGARFKDFGELIDSITTIFFLATPILWMPIKNSSFLGVDERGGFLEVYMNLNPFYHFLEIFRAPLLNVPIKPFTWYVVFGITVFGYLLAAILYRKYRHMLAVWV